MKKRILIGITVLLFLVSVCIYYFFIRVPSYNGIEFVKINKGDNDAIIISRYEITQKQYESVMNENPSFFKGNPDNPAESLSQDEMIAFCIKLSIACNLTPYYELGSGRKRLILHPNADGFRLPMDKEWTYALQGNSSSPYYWGGEVDGAYLWYGLNSGGTTHPVGKKKKNMFGLYDMCGNVFELCLVDKPEGLRGAVFGGSYDTTNTLFFTKGMSFFPSTAAIKDKSIGFRIVKNTPGSQSGQLLNNPKIIYSTALAGLMLRTGPGMENEKIALLPYGTPVTVLETSEKTDTILGHTGKWVKVRWYLYGNYNDSSKFRDGWCFNGFTSEEYPGFVAPPGGTAGTKLQKNSSYEFTIYTGNFYDPEPDPGQDNDLVGGGQHTGHIIFHDNGTVELSEFAELSDMDDKGNSIDCSYSVVMKGVYKIKGNSVIVTYKKQTTSRAGQEDEVEKLDDDVEYMCAETEKYYLLLRPCDPDSTRKSSLFFFSK